MSGLPKGVHGPSGDEFARAWACEAAGDVLWRAEAEACLQVAARSREHGPILGRRLWPAQLPADHHTARGGHQPSEAGCCPARCAHPFPLVVGPRCWLPDGWLVWQLYRPAAGPAALGGRPSLSPVWPTAGPAAQPLWLAAGPGARAGGPPWRPVDAPAARV